MIKVKRKIQKFFKTKKKALKQFFSNGFKKKLDSNTMKYGKKNIVSMKRKKQSEEANLKMKSYANNP